MKISIIKVFIALVILVIIPAASLLLSMQQTNDRIRFEDLSFSGAYGSLTMYYVLMTVVVVALYIIKKIIAFLNRE